MIPDDAVEVAARVFQPEIFDTTDEAYCTCSECNYDRNRVRMRARAALTAAVPFLPAPEGWRPIETAPKDGRKALVYRPRALLSGDEPVDVKRLIGGNHHCWDCTVPPCEKPTNPTDGACHVTHWMPIPAPPALVADNHSGK